MHLGTTCFPMSVTYRGETRDFRAGVGGMVWEEVCSPAQNLVRGQCSQKIFEA